MASTSKDPPKELTGYLHCLSPVKGKNAKKKYFDFAIQTEEKVVRGVCFSPEKKKEIEHFIKTKSPVKVRNYAENDKYGNSNIVIERYTAVSVSEPLPFKAANMEDACNKSIASLSNVCNNQTVTIKGKLTKLYGSKKIPTCNLTKQDGFITDTTGTIKVVFWESFVDQAEEGKSYEFVSFTFKDDKFGRYITSAREGSSIAQVDDLEEIQTPVIDERDIANKEMKLNLIGVSSAQSYYSCCGCKSKIEVQGNTVTCSKCHLTQKVSALKAHWVVKLFAEDKTTSRKFHLTAFDGIVRQLAALVNKSVDNISPEDLKVALLQLDDFSVVCDTTNKTILELS